MKTHFLQPVYSLMIVIFCVASATAQQKFSEEKVLSSFNVLDIRGPFSVELVNADEPKISIDMADQYRGLVQFKVNEGVLSVKWGGITKTIADEIKIRIQVRELSSLTLNTTGAVSCIGELQSKALNVVVMETAKLSLTVNAARIDLTAKGTGAITLSGKTNALSLFNYGKGNIDAAALQAKTTSLVSSGDGDISVYASSQLGITATGAGAIMYYGLPGKVKISNARGARIVNGQRS